MMLIQIALFIAIFSAAQASNTIVDLAQASNTIVDLALATPTLSTLVTALKAGDLVKTLEGPGPFTVFAPTNAAFAALPKGVLANLLKPANKAGLDDVLTYHVLGDEVHSQKFLDGEMLRTLEQKYVTVRIAGKDILINSAKVTTADVQASNGVIHIIDAVLLPSSAPPSPGPSPSPAPGSQNIVQLAQATPDLSTLVTALGAASLVQTLEGAGPFTVFAPTNEAFQNLPAGALANLLKPKNKAKLVDILTFHVVAGDIHAKDILDGERIKTVEGMYIMAAVNESGVFLNNAKVTTADVNASNGVVHIIDEVLQEWNPSPSPGPSPGPGPSRNIVDIALSNPDLSTLVTALKAADLVDTLSGNGPFTVLAPTNEAFAKLPAGALANLLKPENKPQLVALLEYHVLGKNCTYRSCLESGYYVQLPSVQGSDVQVITSCMDRKCKRKKLKVNPSADPNGGSDHYQATINSKPSDIFASNGDIHLIDGVLSIPSTPHPPYPPLKTITNLLAQKSAQNQLRTLSAALKAAGLDATLNGKGPFTLFAPTDSAFAQLPNGTLENLLKPENKAALVDLLEYHVIPGSYSVADFKDSTMYTTVEGKNITSRRSDFDVFINDDKILTFDQSLYDLKASNGYIQMVDTVLDPKQAPTTLNHLYFRGLNSLGSQKDFRCGEIDAAVRMPNSLFLPKNAKYLKMYEDFTINFWVPMYERSLSKIALGRCKDIGYTKFAGGAEESWLPKAVLGPLCEKACHCGGTTGKSCNNIPDDPDGGHWCSLCGNKYNDQITIQLYVK